MNKIKVQYVTNGAIKEVKKELASDYIGTGRFSLFEENKQKNNVEEVKKTTFSKKFSKED